MNADNFIVYIKLEDIYENLVKDVDAKFYSSKYELDRPLPKGRNRKVIQLIKMN